MVPQVQTPSRCCRFLLSRRKAIAQESPGVTRLLSPARVYSGRYTNQRATAVVRRQNPINHPRRTAVVVDLRASWPQVAWFPLASLERLLPHLHSMLGWTTILPNRLCPEICWLATAAVNPHPPNILRDGFCAWNGQLDTGPCTLARCCWEASPRLPRKTSSIAGSSKGKPADC